MRLSIADVVAPQSRDWGRQHFARVLQDRTRERRRRLPAQGRDHLPGARRRRAPLGDALPRLHRRRQRAAARRGRARGECRAGQAGADGHGGRARRHDRAARSLHRRPSAPGRRARRRHRRRAGVGRGAHRDGDDGRPAARRRQDHRAGRDPGAARAPERDGDGDRPWARGRERRTHRRHRVRRSGGGHREPAPRAPRRLRLPPGAHRREHRFPKPASSPSPTWSRR